MNIKKIAVDEWTKHFDNRMFGSGVTIPKNIGLMIWDIIAGTVGLPSNWTTNLKETSNQLLTQITTLGNSLLDDISAKLNSSTPSSSSVESVIQSKLNDMRRSHSQEIYNIQKTAEHANDKVQANLPTTMGLLGGAWATAANASATKGGIKENLQSAENMNKQFDNLAQINQQSAQSNKFTNIAQRRANAQKI